MIYVVKTYTRLISQSLQYSRKFEKCLMGPKRLVFNSAIRNCRSTCSCGADVEPVPGARHRCRRRSRVQHGCSTDDQLRRIRLGQDTSQSNLGVVVGRIEGAMYSGLEAQTTEDRDDNRYAATVDYANKAGCSTQKGGRRFDTDGSCRKSVDGHCRTVDQARRDR